MADKNDKFIMVDKIDEMKPIKKKKIHIDFNIRVIVYGLLIFIFSIGTFISYFSLYLSVTYRYYYIFSADLVLLHQAFQKAYRK